MFPLQEVLLSPIVSRESLFVCRQVDRIVWRSMVPQECPLRIGQMAYFFAMGLYLRTIPYATRGWFTACDYAIATSFKKASKSFLGIAISPLGVAATAIISRMSRWRGVRTRRACAFICTKKASRSVLDTMV